MEFTFDSVSQFDSFSENAENFIRVEILIKIEIATKNSRFYLNWVYLFIVELHRNKIVFVYSLNKRCYNFISVKKNSFQDLFK